MWWRLAVGLIATALAPLAGAALDLCRAGIALVMPSCHRT